MYENNITASTTLVGAYCIRQRIKDTGHMRYAPTTFGNKNESTFMCLHYDKMCKIL